MCAKVPDFFCVHNFKHKLIRAFCLLSKIYSMKPHVWLFLSGYHKCVQAIATCIFCFNYVKLWLNKITTTISSLFAYNDICTDYASSCALTEMMFRMLKF